MVRFEISKRSTARVSDWLQDVRGLVLEATMMGMGDAMEGLAQYTVASKLSGNPVKTRTGNLATTILRSPYVRVTGGMKVIGRISTKGAPEGSFVSRGAMQSEVRGTLMVFTGLLGTTVFTRHRRPYLRKGKPFMKQALREYQSQIWEKINARVNEVLSHGH